MLADMSANAIVYQVLDEVLRQKCVPAGARAAMFSVIDELRAATAGGEDVRRAERISVEMQSSNGRFAWARLRPRRRRTCS